LSKISKTHVANGIYWVEVRDANLCILCGCPADSVKHLMKKGLILNKKINGINAETGPNAILLSDFSIQNGSYANFAEFPVMQMLYRQGMILPGHPNNTGLKPMLIGAEKQVESQIQYIYRGNYGLVTEKEILDTGVSSKTAHELMRMKLKFAYGKIRPIEGFFDTTIIRNDSVEIRNGVYVRRLKPNIFEIQYQGESLTVDLNLAPLERYELPYQLDFHNITREHFAVLHTGEGNGWDIERPGMSSIIMFKGKIYLIDAGPNIINILKSLGISINEIEGIFHTHAHDDHFASLTSLIRSDHRIKYYAAPLVRVSVTKKLSALMSIREECFNDYFEVHDLEIGTWTKVNGLEIKPVISPHPVETTIFIFRASYQDDYRSYAHLADIVNLAMLRQMINENSSEPGITREFFNQVQSSYLTRVNLKKLDAGGELIHGNTGDFQDDQSDKIILSHLSSTLTGQQKEIGTETSFGSIDILIPSRKNYALEHAFNYLRSIFPSAPHDQINILVNNPIVTFTPETALIEIDEMNENMYLVLTGEVVLTGHDLRITRKLSSGSIAGDISGIERIPSRETYRAANYVQALQLPCSLYVDFIKRNELYNDIVELQEKLDFLQKSWLFGNELSYTIQTRIAKAIISLDFQPDDVIPYEYESGLYIVKHGKLHMLFKDGTVEALQAGDFFGECNVLSETYDLHQVRAMESTEVYHIQCDSVIDIPVIHWKLLEIHEKRLKGTLV
jgi:hemerythrin